MGIDVAEIRLGRDGFTSKELDPTTSLYYFGARYYDAWSGRWLSVDPLAKKYPGLTQYCYAGDDPIGIFDPNGQGIRSFLEKLGQAISYNVTLGFQLAGGINTPIGGAQAHVDVVSTQVFSGTLVSKPDVLNGSLSTGGGGKVEVAGWGIGGAADGTLSKTTTTLTRHGIFTDIIQSNSITTKLDALVGPAKFGGVKTETKTIDVSTGQVETKTRKNLEIGLNSDIQMNVAVGLGISIDVNLPKVVDAVKSLSK